jgi:hypothetical protein
MKQQAEGSSQGASSSTCLAGAEARLVRIQILLARDGMNRSGHEGEWKCFETLGHEASPPA